MGQFITAAYNSSMYDKGSLTTNPLMYYDYEGKYYNNQKQTLRCENVGRWYTVFGYILCSDMYSIYCRRVCDDNSIYYSSIGTYMLCACVVLLGGRTNLYLEL